MKLDWLDILVIVSIIANIGAHTATVYIEAKVSGVAGLASAGKALEANPVQQFIQQAGYLQFLFMGLLYGILLGGYIFYKRKSVGNPERELILLTFVLALGVLSITDMLNDAAYVLAII